MVAIELKLESDRRGAFVVAPDGRRLAEMAFAITGKNMIVYHTEVSAELQGQGVALKLLETMVEYVRNHGLMVVALCPYVRAQFTRHPEKYDDIWNRHWRGEPAKDTTRSGEG